VFGSDLKFVRGTAEGSAYRELTDRWVGALAVRLGNFFRTARLDQVERYLPPEERFFAGGAASVRGFERNGLGPGVYVTDQLVRDEDGELVVPENLRPRFVPTGGTAVAVANAELRFPSPVFTELMRLVVFVDAGAVGTGAIWDMGPEEWRLTPGAGLRVRTPVGPVRMDVGINPYARPTAPLLFTDLESGRVTRVRESFQPEQNGTPLRFRDRIRIHFGIGQAF
jgi:outer membrane protein insertion porin family